MYVYVFFSLSLISGIDSTHASQGILHEVQDLKQKVS
jgi:hypothetical protein